MSFFLTSNKILILSPHIDDACLSAGGFISRFSKEKDIHILNIFSKSSFTHFGVNELSLNTRIRKREEKNAYRQLKVNIYLTEIEDWFTSDLLKVERDPILIKNKIIDFIQNLKPDTILLPSDMSCDDPDHQFVHSIKDLIYPLAKIYLYNNQPYLSKVEQGLYKMTGYKKTIKVLYDFSVKRNMLLAYKTQLLKNEIDGVIQFDKNNGGELFYEV
ncbi:PIG-L family deacetylase [Cyclobacterium sp. SYSU L10401]|uniref:PIG-L family deacetylase n=1 Tax=Cyclobacterium sp. SYSU L10401 TaxID=2678657 RepID=UPI0013D6ACFC|nr:PIG-L family deacetylase [Cyclobacterium sp. SYSU L10401]